MEDFGHSIIEKCSRLCSFWKVGTKASQISISPSGTQGVSGSIESHQWWSCQMGEPVGQVRPKARPKFVQRNGSSCIFYIANRTWYFARSNFCLTTTYVYGCGLLTFTLTELEKNLCKPGSDQQIMVLWCTWVVEGFGTIGCNQATALLQKSLSPSQSLQQFWG